MREMKTINSNPAIKTEFVCGFIQKAKIRCGKNTCKCARGEQHTAFYHVWYTNGKRYRKYLRKSDVESVRKACQNHRDLQTRIRAGRNEYKQILLRGRLLLRMISQ